MFFIVFGKREPSKVPRMYFCEFVYGESIDGLKKVEIVNFTHVRGDRASTWVRK